MRRTRHSLVAVCAALIALIPVQIQAQTVGAVLTDQADHLAAGHRQRDAVEHRRLGCLDGFDVVPERFRGATAGSR